MKVLLVVSAILLFSSCVECSTYVNPVIEADSPDPGVLEWNGAYWVVTTSAFASTDNIFPIHTSSDLVHWKLVGYVFQKKPSWASRDYWAPELHLINNQLHVYFAAFNPSINQHCIGLAISSTSSPIGPWHDLGRPLLCNKDIGYIDPTVYTNKSSHYLYWKVDGNAINKPTLIQVQQLNDQGTAVIGDGPKTLLTNNLPWEGICIEAPWIVPRNGDLYLFYSGNMYDSVGPSGTCLYSVGVAKSTHGPYGPFVKRGDPILKARIGDPLTGPGHCSVVADAGRYYMVYHAWSTGKIAGGNPRHMLVDRVEWGADGWPCVADGYPSQTPQPVP